jgi:tRNA modification GTPase
MNHKLTGWDDTIVALATAPGVAAIGVVRISGPTAFEIISKLFPSKKISEQSSHTIHVGLLKDGDEIIDEVVLSLFKGPKSYTGEDTIEISGHGSPFVQQQILQTCIKYGARLSKPGEFTQRAFINGKLDLTQAESVADLIASNTRASQKTSIQQMRGGFSNQLKQMREQLIQFAALIELELDFAMEDVEFADRSQFFQLVDAIKIHTDQMIQSFKLGNVIRNGVSVAIIGKPNAGKSTLLNSLLNEERAIVSEIAGTTRDTIEEVININGVLFRLIDTAGIREQGQDLIENIGMERSLEKMKSADLVVYLYDVATETMAMLQEQLEQFEKGGINYLLAGNKTDKLESAPVNLPGHIYLSAKNKEGIETLKQSIFRATVGEGDFSDQTLITNARHVEALEKMRNSLALIEGGMKEGLSGDLLAIEIRTCLYHLGDITGEVTTDDKLDYIFSKFCIGK